ncbi:MAG: hypothetical protein MK316_06670, partial [Pseudomonadales bacterium]|nr:hypothetical protein [Pseudomonadales bacterium]
SSPIAGRREFRYNLQLAWLKGPETKKRKRTVWIPTELLRVLKLSAFYHSRLLAPCLRHETHFAPLTFL